MWFAMALSVKQQGVKQVPWFSLIEWHQVYQQVYSNEKTEQTKAYKTLLTWKTRMPNLPVGVDCTLSIMQVCLRDLEWSPKIHNGELPISYENDLCLMYSTTLMRFLNQVTNLGPTRQVSMFLVAKHLNIPEWIVSLRHNTAHGQELPSISVLRIAANVLLTWLHDEYWAAEAKALEKCIVADESVKEIEELEPTQEFGDLFELWTAVSLYIHVGYHLVGDIPDFELVETLQDLHSYVICLSADNDENGEVDLDIFAREITDDIRKDKTYTLQTAREVILSEISRYLTKKSVPRITDVVCDELLQSEVFLPNEDVLSIFVQESAENESKYDTLPSEMLDFWRDIVFMLHENRMMETLLMKLIQLSNNQDIDKHKRLVASLWISSIAYSYVKLDVAHCLSRSFEYKLELAGRRLPPIAFEMKVQGETEMAYPHLRDVLWFNLSEVVLPILTDMNVVLQLFLNANEFSVKYMVPILELVQPKLDTTKKQLLLNLVEVYAGKQTIDNESSNKCSEIFTVEDIQNLDNSHVRNVIEENKTENGVSDYLTDEKVRNTEWKLVNDDYEWTECPIGLLPWQIDSMEILKPLETVEQLSIPTFESEVTPGVLYSKDLKMQSQINWDNVLRKRKRLKRKHERRSTDVIFNRALNMIRNYK